MILVEYGSSQMMVSMISEHYQHHLSTVFSELLFLVFFSLALLLLIPECLHEDHFLNSSFRVAHVATPPSGDDEERRENLQRLVKEGLNALG